MLVVIGLLIGAGLAYGGPLTAVGLGIGYLTVALVHLVWPDLERIWKANI
jgi:F0F1-type ATP synthase membrane subunit c/vacuolar-type H+-ATPase subunit K